ncbi:MAG: tetratricopeptide repeat protein [Paludibacteraceae bacterium]
MKKILSLILISLCLTTASAQRSKVYNNPDKLFYDGKEMYDQGLYSTAFRYFDEYYQTLNKDRSPLFAETEYYLASAAYNMQRKDAFKRLETFVENNPHSTRLGHVRFLQGSLYFNKNKYKETIEFLVQTNPSDLSKEEQADYHFRLGYSQLQCGNKEAAKKEFQSLLASNSKYDASAKYYNAYIDYQQKDYEAALPAFTSLEEHPDYEAIVPYYIIQIYYSQKKNEDVIKKGEELLDKYPDNKNNTEVYRLLGECYFQEKDYGNTIQYLSLYESKADQVLRNDMYMLGISYFKTGNCDKAIGQLQKATTIDDLMSQNAYLHLGSCYLKKDDKTSARMAFESASRVDYDKNIQEEALFNYALIVYEQSYSPFNESIIAFQRFLDLFPQSKYADNIYDYMVNVYLTTKNYEEALNSIEKIKVKNAKILEAKQRLLYCMGIQKYTEGDYQKATDYFTLSIEDGKYNRTTEASAIFWRGESNYRLKDFTKSSEDYHKFVNSVGARNCDEFNLAHYNLGYSYFTDKKYNDALGWFRKYINMEEKNKTLIADANNRIGDCYFNKRDFENAENSYAKVYALNGPGADYACFQQGFVQGLRKNYRGKIATLNKLTKAFPNSEYLADAMYEIGRSYIMLGDNKSAIATYDEMALKYPHSALSRKGKLQTAMLYDEMKNHDKSVEIYKSIVDFFPNSVEAKTSLESLKTIYFEKDDVQGYADYVATLGGLTTFEKSEQDSLTYLAAERIYLMEDYKKAIESFNRYLEKFPESAFSNNAHFNLANSYYKTEDKLKAKEEYAIVASKTGNSNMEEALAKLAEIQYDQQEYEPAIETMQKLLAVAQSSENKQAAKIGLLRSYNMLDKTDESIEAASQLINGDNLDPAIQREALYTRAKAYEKKDNSASAFTDYKVLSDNCLDKYGAEAKYRVAEYLLNGYKAADAEKEIFDFINKNTPHQYWLAKSFLLLADIYMQQGNDFEAKQYLLSLKENYKGDDDIATEIKTRLDEISNKEMQKVVNE